MVDEKVILAEKEYLVNVLGKELIDSEDRNYSSQGHITLAKKYWPEYYIGNKIKRGYHVHHIDFNHDNNVVSNLVILTAKEHRLIHKLFDPNQIERLNKLHKNNIGTKRSDKTKAKMSAAQKGKKRSEETCKRIGESKLGQRAWNKGKHFKRVYRDDGTFYYEEQ